MRLLPAIHNFALNSGIRVCAAFVISISRRWNMKSLVRLFVLITVSLVFGFYCILAGLAQAKAAGGKTTVTGCLQKGDEADEFSITGEDGKTYGLRSSAVDLSKHLGHKVTVTGTLKAESYEKEKGEREENEKKEAVEAGDIRVTNLKMVSDTCK